MILVLGFVSHCGKSAEIRPALRRGLMIVDDGNSKPGMLGGLEEFVGNLLSRSRGS